MFPGAYAEISLVARSRSSLTTRTTLYSETTLEVVLQVSLVVKLASLCSYILTNLTTASETTSQT